MEYIEFTIGIIFFSLFLYSLFKYKNRIAAFFSLTCLCIAVYTCGYGLELIAESANQVLFALQIEMFGVVFLPSFWVLVSLELYFRKPSSFRTKFMIFTIPILTLFISTTNSFHYLYYSKLTLVEHNHYLSAFLTKGPWYYFFIFYTYLSLLISIVIYFRIWKKESFRFQTKSFWMLFGSLGPSIAYIVYIFDVFPIYYDITTFGFGFLAICFYIAIFKYYFLDLEQIARDRVFDEIKEGIIVMDQKNRIVDFNRAGKNIFKWLDHDSIGKNMLLYPEGCFIMKNLADKFNIEVIRSGEKRHIGFMMTLLDQKRKLMGKILIFQDITEQTLMMNELQLMATHDPLSGIYNRRKLLEEADKELYRTYRYGTSLSALMLDIDYFKKVNDHYGHLAGDKVIETIAKECQNRLRKSDVIGRYGGEEFLIILIDTNLETACQIAEELRKNIANTKIIYEQQIINVQVSIGVSSTSSYSEKITVNQLINECDKALYVAKNTGRNKVATCFNQE